LALFTNNLRQLFQSHPALSDFLSMD
jgi:hypothetical protein